MKNEIQALNHICKKCQQVFSYTVDQTYFDDKGYGYSTKLIKCPHCNTPNVLRYYEDRAININEDSRYYDYKKHD